MNVSELNIDQCSGCSLCASVCSTQSITIIPDKLGFLHPVVNMSSCLNCSLCVNKCIITNPQKQVLPQKTYAAIRKNKEKILLSSSGGIFAAIAEQVLQNDKDWSVVGCVLDKTFSAKHIVVNDVIPLVNLYGSKYVQSETTGIYEKVKSLLYAGKHVLFSGTPCQVAAVLRYTKNHPNLFTIEVICHGVANNEMFKSYLDIYNKTEIRNFYFRDKKQGWSFNNKIVYNNGKEKKINHRMSSYMTYYLRGEIYRDCCYKCPYAKPERCADITIGDFWGILQSKLDLKNRIKIENGVSCILINSNKGDLLIKKASIELYEVEYEDIKKENGPVNRPSIHTIKRDQILSIWNNQKNWKEVHSYWKKNDRKITFILWSMVPTSLQHTIRVILGKR